MFSTILAKIASWGAGKIFGTILGAVVIGIGSMVLIHIYDDFVNSKAEAAVYKQKFELLQIEHNRTVYKERQIQAQLKADKELLEASLEQKHQDILEMEVLMESIRHKHKATYNKPTTPAVTAMMEALRNAQQKTDAQNTTVSLAQ